MREEEKEQIEEDRLQQRENQAVGIESGWGGHFVMFCPPVYRIEQFGQIDI